MKRIIIYIIISTLPILVKAQWKNIPINTKFYYSGFSYRAKIVETKNDESKLDTLWKNPIQLAPIKLDMIIHLSGFNRNLIVFSNCIDSLFLHHKRIIVKGKIDDLPKNKYGVLDYSLYENIPEDEKATVLYQSNTEIYALTVPKYFSGKYLHDTSLIKKLDADILNLKVESGDIIPQIDNTYLFFQNISIPIIPFIEVNQKITKNNQNFETSFYTYESSSVEKKNNLFKKVDWYGNTKGNVDKGIGLNNKFGIVESDYELEDGDYCLGVIIQLRYVE